MITRNQYEPKKIKNKMKYLIIITNLVFILLLGLFSCNEDEDTVISISTTDFTKSIEENPVNDTSIGFVEGSTNEGNVQFEIVEQNPNDAFKINQTTGELTVKENHFFDFELNKIITGIVKVSNRDVFKNVNVVINITNVTCIPTELQDNVILFYPFSKGSINDFSGNNQNLTNPTTAISTSDRSGNLNCAFEFDFLSGTNEFLTTTKTDAINNLTDFSISLWYQPLKSRDAGNYELLLGKGEGPIYDLNLGLYDCRKALFSWTGYVWDNDPNFNCGVSDFDNNWHNLVVTYNNDTSTMKLYRNSVLQETSNTIYYPDVSHLGDLFIGEKFTGKIDDIILFNKILDQDEINVLLNIESCCNE